MVSNIRWCLRIGWGDLEGQGVSETIIEKVPELTMWV